MQTTIGRFEVVRKLGKGAQGEVFLARDPHLDRQVAIKTLKADAGSDVSALLQEARIVSKLLHQNIVTLFDAGEHAGKPYVVYAYVQGETLAQLLKSEGTLPLTQAAQIMCSVLDAMEHAHSQGIMHLDIKPANIMLSTSGQTMVMDFGIAQTITQTAVKDHAINGSPYYIAPEVLFGKSPTPRSDLFSIGMVLYELVTGAPAVIGDNVQQILYSNAHEPSESPSARNVHIDDRLEAIILKSLAKQPEERYADAASMRQALVDYLDPTREALPGNSQAGPESGTLNFLLRRMRSKSDFPALSSTISEINKIVDNDSSSTNHLTHSILQDFSLTNKLLKLVNTASYSQFGGKVNTISKAVTILGFETVRGVAMTLILFEFLQNKALAAQLKDDVLMAFFAGIVASKLPAADTIRNAEETMICSMFRHLGKLLATFYFFEESQEIERLMEQGNSEENASYKVLGITYNELAIGIAKSWNFPQRLLLGMRKLTGEKISKAYGELDNLAIAVNLANDLCNLANKGKSGEKTKALKQLVRRYENAMSITDLQLHKALENALVDLNAHADIIRIDIAKSELIQRLKTWVGASLKDDTAKKTIDPSLEGVTQLGMEPLEQDGKQVNSKQHDAENILTEGIQEVTNTLLEDFKLNDIMQMVLEVMHRGMKFQRTMIFVRDAKTKEMVARFGFGRDSDAILPKFRFSAEASSDVFGLAVTKGLDLLIEDIDADNMAGKIPKWYTNAVTSRSFILLPVMLNGKAVGLLYADMEKNAMKIAPRQLSLLRTLRNQAILAIKQKN